MKVIAIALFAVSSIAGVAHAQGGASDKQFVQASYCAGLAGSENLGKVDTTSLDAFLRTEGEGRKMSVKVSGASKAAAARRKADAAKGGRIAQLVAERDHQCAGYFNAAK